MTSMHDELKVLGARVEQEGWKAEIEPIIADYQPDLVVSLPDGTDWIVEIKESFVPLHMADLGQVASFVGAWNRERAHDRRPAKGMILTRDDPTEFFKDAAAELGVEVLTSRKWGRDLADEFVSRLHDRVGPR